MGQLWDRCIEMWRAFDQTTKAFAKIFIVGFVVLWIGGSIHAGHILSVDGVVEFALQWGGECR